MITEAYLGTMVTITSRTSVITTDSHTGTTSYLNVHCYCYYYDYYKEQHRLLVISYIPNVQLRSVQTSKQLQSTALFCKSK
jgi:hypothetical protein